MAVIFNRGVGGWHTNYPGESQDALRVSVATETGSPMETLTYYFPVVGILVTITTADEHTAYSGPTDFKTNYTVLVEARQVQDFEGTVQWGLGLSKSACYRAFFIANPVRLVIDVQNT